MKTQHYCVQTVEQAMMVVVLHFGLLHGTIRGHLRNYAFIQAAEEKKGKAKKAKKKAAKKPQLRLAAANAPRPPRRVKR